MANKFGDFHISDIYYVAKTNRTIRFIISIGAIVCVDAIVDITSIFNGFVQMSTLKIFGLKIDNVGMYTSIYASIAVLISSNLVIIEKLKYSIGLFITYVGIFTFVIAYEAIFPYYSLYLTLVVFVTMAIPILLWIMLDGMDGKCSKSLRGKYSKNIDGKRSKNVTRGARKHETRR